MGKSYRFDKRTGEICELRHVERPDVNAPFVIGDEMNKTWNPCDGREYTSKSAFRAVIAANDCVEIGNERLRPTPAKKPPVSDTLRDVLTQSGGLDRKRAAEFRQQIRANLERAENMRGRG